MALSKSCVVPLPTSTSISHRVAVPTHYMAPNLTHVNDLDLHTSTKPTQQPQQPVVATGAQHIDQATNIDPSTTLTLRTIQVRTRGHQCRIA